MEGSLAGATSTHPPCHSRGVCGFFYPGTGKTPPLSCTPWGRSGLRVQDTRQLTWASKGRVGFSCARAWRGAGERRERAGRGQVPAARPTMQWETRVEVKGARAPPPSGTTTCHRAPPVLEEETLPPGCSSTTSSRSTSALVVQRVRACAAAGLGLGLVGWTAALFGPAAAAWASSASAGGGAAAAATEEVATSAANLLAADGGSDFQSGFASAFLLIFFSEIGDKTFFIAALLAARKSGAPVFVGTFAALAAMTVVSVALGRGFHYADEVLPFGFGQTQVPLDDLAAVVLLLYFGVTTLASAASMDDSGLDDEKQEAELAIAAAVDDGGGSGAGAGALQAVAGTVAGTFALVFVAEWGDKSFFSTIALAAASDPLGVVSGAVAGHGAATLLAVLGGTFLSQYLSEKVIAYTGGALFLVFAALTLVDISQRL